MCDASVKCLCWTTAVEPECRRSIGTSSRLLQCLLCVRRRRRRDSVQRAVSVCRLAGPEIETEKQTLPGCLFGTGRASGVNLKALGRRGEECRGTKEREPRFLGTRRGRNAGKRSRDCNYLDEYRKAFYCPIIMMMGMRCLLYCKDN